ncbi:long-chain acyl-CoA synthetase [Singulisphaera sp. GP187]|uniref:class I adenylate-forming enzyme family protein n=1 Tax=Singulisphaera sp. GP187 TaxID=1882752 RepID=UPI00092B13C2|nr:AMP-binding protein [Singulisphaera sp. GP187]SIO06913.1 long-chain acyl-CoA synthetase [Singulisphaera sp. GP187]
MNVATLLTEAALERPNHPAFVFEGQSVSYQELERLTGQFANLLSQHGVRQGDVIAIFLESCPELIIAYFGALKAGVVPNVVNASLKPEEVRLVVSDSKAILLLTDPTRWESLEPVRTGLGTRLTLVTGHVAEHEAEDPELKSFDAALAETSSQFETLELAPEALANLLYTSGTTGFAKGVMLSHRNLIDNAINFARIHYTVDDRLLIAAPLFHSWGLINGLLSVFVVGATAIVPRRYRTEPMLELIEATRPTILLGVATMINYMSKSPSFPHRNLDSLRVVHCAAAPMPLELIETMRRSWKVGYAESYGLTETSPVITTTPHTEMRPGSCGRAMGDTILKVVDAEGETVPPGAVGELWAWGTAIAAGYYGQPALTAEVFTADGWFKTGDVARIDQDGYVFIVDRVKDMINVGGAKVYPRDVEEVLHRHPAVADAVVIGIPDPDLGEVVKAYVALKPDHAWTPEGVLDYLRPELAAFKLPRAVEFVPEVPRSVSGKALRRLLR